MVRVSLIEKGTAECKLPAHGPRMLSRKELMWPGCSNRGGRERARQTGSGSISEDTAKAALFNLDEKEAPAGL